jgi:hypothetical protein
MIKIIGLLLVTTVLAGCEKGPVQEKELKFHGRAHVAMTSNSFWFGCSGYVASYFTERPITYRLSDVTCIQGTIGDETLDIQEEYLGAVNGTK